MDVEIRVSCTLNTHSSSAYHTHFGTGSALKREVIVM